MDADRKHMTDASPLDPALTPEEWRKSRFIRPELVASATHKIVVAYTPGDRHTLAADEDRHALAALCLYGQPFGFTHEDVARLRAAPDVYGGVGSSGEREWWRFVGSLISRIQALLPPLEPAP